MALNKDVAKLLFVSAAALPPVADAYHLYCPFVPPDAVSVTAVEAQPLAPVAVGLDGGVFIVAITTVRVLSQLPLFIAT